MELERVDTQRAYERIRDRIVTLDMRPGAPIDEQQLAEELGIALVPIQEALKLLVHDNLVAVTLRHGFHVADVDLADLEQISEMRLALEGLCARLAAQRATPDDLVVLDSLRQVQAVTPFEDTRRLFDLDHKFHQAVARAAHNRYLASTLERYFGLSLRLWYLVMPRLGPLSGNVVQHLELIEAIRTGDGDQAEAVMRHHVASFYDKVRKILQEGV